VSDPDFNAEASNIAIEQRMVRAEVVFLGGGEVQDELEEAAQSDELTEGPTAEHRPRRNAAGDQRDVRARGAVERGRAAEALVFEKQALASLEARARSAGAISCARCPIDRASTWGGG
jgi:hypothetical protein